MGENIILIISHENTISAQVHSRQGLQYYCFAHVL